MAWTKHFRSVQLGSAAKSNYVSMDNIAGGAIGTSAKFSSYLPEVYAGHPQRIQRYYQYADMDKDSDVSVALNTVADFCTQSEEQSDAPFFINYNQEGNDTEIKLLKNCLDKWVKLNKFRKSLWQIFRNALQNGDAFFLRDPQTSEWLWQDHFAVIMVKVDEDKGRVPAEYVVKGLDYSAQAKFATSKLDTSTSTAGTASAYASRAAGTGSGGAFQLAGSHIDTRAHKAGQAGVQDISVIDAKHVIHLSLSQAMDVNWPFGQSVLDPVYKVYRQKEMLEDSIIIYRTTRAPERRIFKIDTGDLPPHKAQAFLLKLKNEIHQRRIPNRNGGGTGSVVDGAYNPLAIMDDYYFAQAAGGRGSTVDVLPGGDNLGEIGDLDYFTRKFARAMQIPKSYLAVSDENSNAIFNDGKGGTGQIEEFRFNKFCMRLQALLEPKFDEEFKKYVEDSGVNVEEDLYELRFNPPQNFSKYRQIDLDSQQMQVYSTIQSSKVISERMKFTKYAGWSEEDVRQNEEWWAQENPKKLEAATGSEGETENADGGLGAIGIRSGDDMDFPEGGEEDPLDGEGGEDGANPSDPAAGGPPVDVGAGAGDAGPGAAPPA